MLHPRKDGIGYEHYSTHSVAAEGFGDAIPRHVSAWAECTNHDEQAWSGQGVHSELMLAASESGSSDDDDTADDPDSNEDDT